MQLPDIKNGDFLRGLRTNRTAAEKMASGLCHNAHDKENDRIEFTGRDGKTYSMHKTDTQLSTVTSRLYSGQELSSEELEYLRCKNPELYQKAASAVRARQELRKKLRDAKTSEEVQSIRMGLTTAALSAGQASVSPGAGGVDRAAGTMITTRALENEWVKSRPRLDRLELRKKRKFP